MPDAVLWPISVLALSHTSELALSAGQAPLVRTAALMWRKS
jgi:hypothetical protein